MNLRAGTTLPPPGVERLNPPRAVPPGTRFLDGLRGLAALYVLVHHALWLAQSVPAGGAWAKVLSGLAAAFKYGHLAVIFFFVLSGFVIHLRYARQLHDDQLGARFGWSDFILRRARRLYPPLLAALLITWLCDLTGTALSFPSWYAGAGETYAWVPGAMRDNHAARTFLGNLVFLMQMHVPHYGTDSPLWSLAYEWWFYMLYPLLWKLSKRSVLLATAIVLALFVLTRFPGGWPPIEGAASDFNSWQTSFVRRVLAALPAWWCGALLADVYAGRVRVSVKSLSLLLLALPLAMLPSVPEAARTLGLGIGFCGLIALGFHLQQRGLRLRLLDRLKFAGDFSYTLYVIHMPLVIFLWGIWAKGAIRMPFSGPVGLLLLVALPMCIASVVHLIVEQPFTGGRRENRSHRQTDLR